MMNFFFYEFFRDGLVFSFVKWAHFSVHNFVVFTSTKYDTTALNEKSKPFVLSLIRLVEVYFWKENYVRYINANKVTFKSSVTTNAQ